MLSPELVAKINRIHLRAGRRASALLMGEYRSAFRGSGMEFEELREYFPGDDIRGIDWNVTARMQKPFVKVFREERQRNLMLVVDASASLWLAGKGSSKRDLAAELAAILAFLASRHNDRIGLLIFSEDIELYLKPAKGRGHVWQLIKTILSFEPQGRGTNFKAPMEMLQRILTKRTSIFFISDFLQDGDGLDIRWLTRKHDAYWFRVLHPLEQVMPEAGLVAFADLEVKSGLLAKAFFAAPPQQSQQLWQNIDKLARGRTLQLRLGDDPASALEHFFGKERST